MKRKFTLIELLVCIAIIAIIASLLLPALKSAKNRGDSSNCSGNIKNFGYAFASYNSAYDDWYPPHTIYDKDGKEATINGTKAKYAWTWGYQMFKDNMAASDTYKCRTHLSMVEPPDSSSSNIHTLLKPGVKASAFCHISYGYNTRFFGIISSRVNGASWEKNRPVKASEIRNTSAMVLTDIATLDANGHPEYESEYQFLDQTNIKNVTYAHGRHNKSGNLLRADGSGATIKNPELMLHRGYNKEGGYRLLNWYRTK